MRFSKYQKAVFKWTKSRSLEESCIVLAAPGSGKSTTATIAATQHAPPGARVAIASFNRSIRDRLQTVLKGTGIPAYTFNQLGMKFLPGCAVTRGKYRRIVKEWCNRERDNLQLDKLEKGELDELTEAIQDVARLTQYALVHPQDEAGIMALMKRHDTPPKWHETILRLVPEVLFEGINQASAGIVDLEDQTWLPSYTPPLAEPWFDLLIIDEVQDISPSELFMLMKCSRHLMAIGDEKQSIYGFKCAIDTIPLLKEKTAATVLALSISYRLPTSHVSLVNSIFPNSVEAAPNAIPGTIEYHHAQKLLKLVEDGNESVMVISPTNAPLVSHALKLLSSGITVKFPKRNLQEMIVKTVRRVTWQPGFKFERFLEFVESYESMRLASMGFTLENKNKITRLLDETACVRAIYESKPHKSIQEMWETINSLFKDSFGAATFSTVHGAKGLESHKVIVLNPQGLEVDPLERPWEQAQRKCLKFVAYSRSKNELIVLS